MTHWSMKILGAEVQRTRWGTLVLLGGLFSLTGCAVGPKYHRPSAPTSPTFKEIGSWKTAQPSDHNLGGNWWEIFQDPQLNALEQQVNVSNQNLKAAVAQYQEARAALRYASDDVAGVGRANVEPVARLAPFAADQEPPLGQRRCHPSSVDACFPAKPVSERRDGRPQ